MSFRGRAAGSIPSNLNAVGGMLLGGGIYAICHFLMVGTFSYGICCLWPGNWSELVWGIFAIIRGSAIMNRNVGLGPPMTLVVLQILLIFNGDPINTILGIVSLVMLNDSTVKEYFESRQT
ncbi:MAG: hypothetical protein ACRC8S_03695 [Fimbriiglobus sp.]